MSYTYLSEQGVESLAASFMEIPASVLSRLSLTAEKFCCNGSETESCHDSQSGMTSEHSTANLGAGKLMLSAEDSHAKTSAVPEKEQESKASKADSGEKWQGWFTKLCPITLGWRTRQCYFTEDLEPSCETWPKWGMMRDGACWEQTPPDLSITEPDCGWLPTPSGTSNHGRNHVCGRLDEWGGSSNPWRKTPIGKVSCPSFEEWMMGWPITWTAPIPLEMDKFQQWLRSHGEF